MGFMPAVKEILDDTSQIGQRLLFSATLDKDVDALVKKYLRDPIEHSVESAGISHGEMDHHVFFVKQEVRDEMLAQIGAREGRTIMFVRTQRGADRLAEKLQAQGVAAGTLHGGKAQGARTKALEAFKTGKTPVLVATNVAARGIHVDDVSLVVHADAPTDPKDYLHRAGRTARAGESGTVVTLARMNQQREMKFLIKKALVEATFTQMDIANPELVRITGAQEPTGEPWFPAIEHAPKKRRSPRPGGHAGEGGSGAAGRHKPRHKPRTGGSGTGGSGSGGSATGGSGSDRPKSSGGGGRGRAGGSSGRPGGRPGGQSGGRPGGKPAGKSGSRTGGKPGGSRPAR
jgi:superfamily II DNA/RNA helicase